MNHTDEIKSILEGSTKRAEAMRVQVNRYLETLCYQECSCIVADDAGHVERCDRCWDIEDAEHALSSALPDIPARYAALMVAVDALADFASGLSGPYKVDRAEHAEAVIGATEARCAELLASILAILKGEK